MLDHDICCLTGTNLHLFRCCRLSQVAAVLDLLKASQLINFLTHALQPVVNFIAGELRCVDFFYRGSGDVIRVVVLVARRWRSVSAEKIIALAARRVVACLVATLSRVILLARGTTAMPRVRIVVAARRATTVAVAFPTASR